MRHDGLTYSAGFFVKIHKVRGVFHFTVSCEVLSAELVVECLYLTYVCRRRISSCRYGELCALVL